MKCLLAICLLLMTFTCHAAIYQTIDNSGNTVYSDQPIGQNAQRIDMGSKQNPAILNTSPDTTSSQPPATIAPAETAHTYTVFTIDTPKDLDTFQNSRSIPVEIKIDPALQKGDSIQLILDGKPWGSTQNSPHLSLDQADRGTHQLSAVILDSNQRIIKQSNTITIYNHLASKLSNHPGN